MKFEYNASNLSNMNFLWPESIETQTKALGNLF